MQRVCRTLWLLFLGFLRTVLEVLLFLPRYLLLERHDHPSAFWGTRGAPVLLFASSPWSDAVVRRIESLSSAKNATATMTLASTPRARTRTAEVHKPGMMSLEVQQLKRVESNSFSICTTPNPRHGAPENDCDLYGSSDITICDADYGNTSTEVVVERQRHISIRESVTVVLFSVLSLLRSVFAFFVTRPRIPCEEAEVSTSGVQTPSMLMMGDAHFLHGVFAEGVPFVDYSLLRNLSVEWDALQSHNLQGKGRMEWGNLHSRLCGGKGGVLSCWFRNKMNEEQFIHVPYKPLLRKIISSRSFWSYKKDHTATNNYYYIGGNGSGSNSSIISTSSSSSSRRCHERYNQKNGFIPPWYAVHGKSQLLLSFLDPLWRIITEMLSFSYSGDEAESHVHSPSSLTGETNQDGKNSSNKNNKKVVTIHKRHAAVGLLHPRCTYVMEGCQQGENTFTPPPPPPVEEICFFSSAAVKALVDRFSPREEYEQREQKPNERWKTKAEKKEDQERDHMQYPLANNYTSSQSSIKNSVTNTETHVAASTKTVEGTLESDIPVMSTKGKSLGECMKATLFPLKSQKRKSKVVESSGTEEPSQVFKCGHRASSVRWLHGSTPPEGPNSMTPVVILLLCPSVVQGGEHGYVARRMGALCESLTKLAELRREGHKRRDYCGHYGQTKVERSVSSSESWSSARHGDHDMSKNKAYYYSSAQCTDTEMESQNSKKTKAVEASDVRFATWHAAVPVAEVLCWSEDAPPSSASHRERVPLTVEDIDHITRYLGKMRRVTVLGSDTVGDAPLEFGVNPTGAEEEEEEEGTDQTSNASTLPPGKCNTQQHRKKEKGVLGKTTTILRRKVYIVGVGWSSASGPLLQYVVSYGAQSRIDGLICMNHTFSSNYTLTPEGESHSSSKHGMRRERIGGVKAYKMPLHRTFLSAPGGAVRLILLAARLQMMANHLRRRRRRRQLQQQKQQQEEEEMGKVALTEDSDIAVWRYLRHRVSTVAFPSAVDGSYQRNSKQMFGRRLQESPPPPATSTSAETPIEALLNAGKYVEREVNAWWLDEVQPANNTHTGTVSTSVSNTNANTSNTSHTYFETEVAPPVHSSSGRWHPVMSLDDWDTLFQQRENVPAATLLAACLSRLQVSPPLSPHTPYTLDSPRSSRGNDRQKHNAAYTHPNEHVDLNYIVPQVTAQRQLSSVFDMARGRLESTSSQSTLLQESLQGGGGRHREAKQASEVQRQRVRRNRRSPIYVSPDPTMMALREDPSTSAHLASLVRVPTLFIHAKDDEIAPLASLPLRSLATNPKIFAVLTRRGGYGVFLEGLSTLFTLPQLTLQERPRRNESNQSNNDSVYGDERPSVESKVRKPQKQKQQRPQKASWWPNWMQREKGTATLLTPATMGALPATQLPKYASHKKKGDKDDLETVFVIEGTTWMERLLVEFIASAILTQSPSCETASSSSPPPPAPLFSLSLEPGPV